MYLYKRGKGNLAQAKRMLYVLANTRGTHLCMNGVLEAKNPYSGLYIKKGKVILENLLEEIEIKDKLYKISQLTTSVQTISCDEYIAGIDLTKNQFSYAVDKLSYTKTLLFAKYDDLFCIEYDFQNHFDFPVLFRVMPLITYRDILTMRNATTLRFNQRNIQNGMILNLSVTNEENLFIKSDQMYYTKNPRILNHIKHEMTDKFLKKEIYTEDLFSPGEFEVSLCANSSQKIYFYVSSKDFDVQMSQFEELKRENEFEMDKILTKIPEEFVELRDMARGIENLRNDHIFISSLPYREMLDYDLTIHHETNSSKFLKDIEQLTNILCSIEGEFIILDKLKEAEILLSKIRRAIREIDALMITDEFCYEKVAQLKLWYIEVFNKLYQKRPGILEIYLGFIKEVLYDLLKEEKQKITLSNILTCALSYNAIKIYENMLSKLGYEDEYLSSIAICIQNLVEKEFWVPEKKVMKRYITDESAYANIEMLYTLSLSYPCVFGNIPIKLLDTIFKELYTPYGLREYPKNSLLNDGLIYPKYMAHFVKANLRQNGVTRASQKIAYNLVKELIQDISKFINGGVKMIYQENGILIDESGYDLLTNAEVIRLYDMLT